MYTATCNTIQCVINEIQCLMNREEINWTTHIKLSSYQCSLVAFRWRERWWWWCGWLVSVKYHTIYNPIQNNHIVWLKNSRQRCQRDRGLAIYHYQTNIISVYVTTNLSTPIVSKLWMPLNINPSGAETAVIMENLVMCRSLVTSGLW